MQFNQATYYHNEIMYTFWNIIQGSSLEGVQYHMHANVFRLRTV